MKKILILNLTRFGDLLQTTPLMAGLKQSEPDCEITLLANVNFAGICKHLPGIDRLKIFDVKRCIQADGGGTSYLDIYCYLDGLIKELTAEKFDMLVNLTHSKLSAFFCRALDVKDVRGICASKDGFRVVSDPWLIYFSSFTNFRRYNSFNLVDIYQLGGGVKPAGRKLLVNHEAPAMAANRLLRELGISSRDRIVGLQAGASLAERRWPAEKFAETADIISEKQDAVVLLLGAESEKELAQKVASHMKRPAINLAGKTSLEQLIGVVKICDLLITNDTATMHIAAGVDTPIVALFFVHAYGAETGPYAEGSIVIEPEIPCFPCPHKSECPHYACFDRVTPEDVANAVDLLPEIKKHKKAFINDSRFPTARLYSTYFDTAGFIDLMPIKKASSRETQIFSRMYRHLLRSDAGETSGDDDSWVRYLQGNFMEWPKNKTSAWVKKKRAIFGQLAAIADEAMQNISRMKSNYRKGNLESLKRGGPKIEELDRAIIQLAHTNEELMPLVAIFDKGKQNITDERLNAMLEKTALLYAGMRDSARRMGKLLSVWDRECDAQRSGKKFVDCIKP